MPSEDNRPFSLAEVVERQDGWIDEGLTAVVRSIEQKTAQKTGRKFWVCQLGDTTGSASAEMAVFAPPKFGEGDLIEVTGKGLKFENGQYGPKISLGKTSEVHKVGGSVHHQDQEDRRAAHQPSLNGGTFNVNGQTVGMAIKESISLLTDGLERDEVTELLKQPHFYASIHETASDIIRVALLLEKGKLAKPIRVRTGVDPEEKPVAPPPRLAPRAAASVNERVASNTDQPPYEDIPF